MLRSSRGFAGRIIGLATDSAYFNHVAVSLLAIEVLLLVLIIKYVPYTEIDWIAYMQEVEGVLNGTFNYGDLRGDTGPLVYPAGFVYVFAFFYCVTENGTDLAFAQQIFAALYIVNLTLVLRIYSHLVKEKYPPYLLLFLGLTGYRIHSIYVLRLFNDPVAMLLLYCAVLLFLNYRWTSGCAVFSLAVSVKMNILLFAPGLLIVLLLSLGWRGTILQLIVCATIQIILGIPFIINNPWNYIQGAFNFGRQFSYQWTVNWRLLPEWIFLHRWFHIALLISQLLVLLLFTLQHWIRHDRIKLHVHVLFSWRGQEVLSHKKMLWILFTSNFIGMTFSRSLHYQFYVWYFHSLPFLLWSTSLNPVTQMGLLLLIEWAWNVYPSTVLSSLALHLAHFIILWSTHKDKIATYRKDY